MLVKCGFGSQKNVKSTLKRSYLSSRFFESAFTIFNFFNGISGVGQKINLVVHSQLLI